LKKLLCISIIMVLLCGLVACNNETDKKSDSQTSEGEEIRANIILATNRSDFVDDGTYDEWISKFNEKYPGIEVEVESFADYHNTIKTRIAAGEAPDVFLVKPGRFKQSDYPKYFAPLDDIGITDDIYGRAGGSYDGKLYYIPYGVNKTGITYNKKAFEKAGIEKAPITIEEFYEACDKLVDAGIVPFSSMIVDTWTGPRVTELLAPLYGESDVYTPMLETDTPLTMDSQIGKAVAWTYEMNKRGYMEADPISTNYDTAKAKLASGEIAMVAMEQWFIAQLLDAGTDSNDIGFMPIPVDNSGDSYSLIDPDNCYVVSKDSENIEASKLLVKFLMEDVYEEWIDATGLFSARKSLDGILKMDQAIEFNGYNPTLIERSLPTDKCIELMNECRWNWDDLADEASISEDLDALFDIWNEKWSDVR